MHGSGGGVERTHKMDKAIIGEKLGMTQVFKEDAVIPVTVIKADPCVVTQLKDKERDGYEAVQLGYGEVKPERANRPMTGHCEKAGAKPARFFAEVPLDLYRAWLSISASSQERSRKRRFVRMLSCSCANRSSFARNDRIASRSSGSAKLIADRAP